MIFRNCSNSSVTTFLVFCGLFFSSNALSAQAFKKTTSGLEYRIIKKGKKEPVRKSHRLFLYYTTKINSDTSVFDSSLPGQVFKYIVGEGEGLKGWDEALSLLNIGDSAVFRIPPGLAFGEKKVGKIPANASLLFSVHVAKQEPAYFERDPNLKVLKLDSGLLKYPVQSSNGKRVLPYQVLTMNFTGYIKDEQGRRRIFQSSSTNSNKAVFQINAGRMVPGLEKGLASMVVGEKAIFEISPQLGFGDKKNGIIPANSKLFFDIEIIEAVEIFFQEPVIDTLYGFNNLKVLKRKVASGPLITEDQIVKLHCITYKLNKDGQKIVLNNTREVGEAVTMRAGAPAKSMGLNLGLSYLRSGEKATISVPFRKDLGTLSNDSVTVFYHDVEILQVLPYPFFDGAGKDTISMDQQLKYIIVNPGNGTTVTGKQKLSFAYTGYFIRRDGSKFIFDASRESGKQLVFETGTQKVIPGFEMAIKGMKLGEARTIFIPAQLAYGENGVSSAGVPPNTNLCFDVELIQMQTISNSSNNQSTE